MEQILAESDDCIKVIGLDGSLLFMSEGGQRVMEIDDFDAIRGCPWPDFWEGAGNAAAVSAIQAALSGKSARFEGAANTAKGNPRHWDVRVSPILADDGSVSGILSVSRDISEIKNFEERQVLLRRELGHRIRNLLALVSSVANQTLRDDASITEARKVLSARLAALASAQDILIHRGGSTTLMSLANALAVQIAGDRMFYSGPDVKLSAATAQSLALTLHELATNAAKYGALSNDSGRVDITWHVDREDGKPLMFLKWVESGGPPVTPPTRKGFGSLMIGRAIETYVGGRAKAEFLTEGLRFTLEADLHALGTD